MDGSDDGVTGAGHETRDRPFVGPRVADGGRDLLDLNVLRSLHLAIQLEHDVGHLLVGKPLYAIILADVPAKAKGVVPRV